MVCGDFFLHTTCGPIISVHVVMCVAPPQLKLAEHQTIPPGYLTESELISLMEKHAIGTVSGRDWGLSGRDWRVFIMY